MKKTFFYLAMAVMTAMCMTACEESDDNDSRGEENNTSAIVTPTYDDEACTLTPNAPIDLGSGYSLMKIDLTESGKAYFLLKKDNEFYINSVYTYKDKVYTMNSKTVKGTIEIMTARSTQTVSLKVNITIHLTDGTVLTIDSTMLGDILWTMEKNDATGDKDLFSSWKIIGITLDLKGDVKGYKEFPNGNLANIRDFAEEQGADFTEKERKDFEKTIEYVTITKNGLMTFDYSDGTSDGGDWNWVNNQYKQLQLKLQDRYMGNKFIVDNASIDYTAYKEKARCELRLNANISGNKKYEAHVTFLLQQVPEVK